MKTHLDDSKRPEQEGAAPDAEPRGVERFILPYFTDSSLWPVTIVLLAALSMFGATVLLLALGERNLFAVAALLILAVGSVESLVREVRRRRRIGAVFLSILAVWLLSALVAGVALRYGLF
jgi:hypothetical protein